MLKNLAIIEMIHEDEPEICIANEIWLSEEGRLKWPPKNIRGVNQRKFLSLSPASDWLEFTEFNVLTRGIKTIKKANERLNFYTVYENTLDKLKQDAEKQEKRKHPVRHLEQRNLNITDYNNVFDELKEGSTSTPNVSLTDKQKSVKSTLCSFCGEEASTKCDSCDALKFCLNCDALYHTHPKRTTHLRQKLETLSNVPRSVQVSRHEHEDQKKQAQSSTSARLVKSAGNDDQHFFIPLSGKVKKRTSQQKPKSLSKTKARIFGSSERIQNKQLDDHNSRELPKLPVSIQKISQTISAASSKTLGWLNSIKDKENQNEGETILHEQNSLQNLDIISKREKDLQALSGNSNDIAENKEEKKKTKRLRVKNDKLMKSSAKQKRSENSGDNKENSSENKEKAVPEKEVKLMKSSKVIAGHALSSVSSNIKPTVTAGDNKSAKKIESYQSVLTCFVCGLLGEIKCDQCNSIILCVNCDNMYHIHPLRSGHLRRMIEVNETKDQHIDRETEIEKPAEMKIMKSADYQNHQNTTAGLSSERRPPPQLLSMEKENVSQAGSVNELSHVRGYQFNSSFQGGHVDEVNAAMLDSDQEIETSSNEVLNQEIKTNTRGSQKKEKQPAAKKCNNRIVKRTVPSVKGRNPLNKRLLLKMFAIMKSIKKDNKGMEELLTQMKRNQVVLRNKLQRANTEIEAIKELHYVQTPKETITIDRSFVMPKMPIESVVVTDKLERKCLDDVYSDQLAVRFQKLSATKAGDVKPAIKRIMGSMFTLEHLMRYSWTGRSELNSGTEEKKKFSCLIGIQSMVTKAATLKISVTPSVEKECLTGIKDVVRRASQNFGRLLKKENDETDDDEE